MHAICVPSWCRAERGQETATAFSQQGFSVTLYAIWVTPPHITWISSTLQAPLVGSGCLSLTQSPPRVVSTGLQFIFFSLLAPFERHQGSPRVRQTGRDGSTCWCGVSRWRLGFSLFSTINTIYFLVLQDWVKS